MCGREGSCLEGGANVSEVGRLEGMASPGCSHNKGDSLPLWMAPSMLSRPRLHRGFHHSQPCRRLHLQPLDFRAAHGRVGKARGGDALAQWLVDKRSASSPLRGAAWGRGLHCLPKVPMGIETRLPTMVSCSLTHPELASSHPCVIPPSPACASWGRLPNKPLALESLSQSILVEQLNPRQWLKSLSFVSSCVRWGIDRSPPVLNGKRILDQESGT